METRGRKKNNDVIAKVKELHNNGLKNQEIAEQLDISCPMVRYYLGQDIVENIMKKRSLTNCFFSQPKEVQERIAKEIGYELASDDDDDSLQVCVDKYHEEVAKISNESPLLLKCRNFLDGKIPPNEIEEVFSRDEMLELSQNPMFMEKSQELFGAKKSKFTAEEVINELKNRGI